MHHIFNIWFVLKKQERVEELRHWLERHQFHISQMEKLMRMVDNDAVSVEQVRGMIMCQVLVEICCFAFFLILFLF